MGDTKQFLVNGERLIEEFKNGEDLMQESPLFSKIFYSLCMGESVHHALEDVVIMVEAYQKQLLEIIEKGVPAIHIELNKENIDLVFREAFFSDSDFPDW